MKSTIPTENPPLIPLNPFAYAELLQEWSEVRDALEGSLLWRRKAAYAAALEVGRKLREADAESNQITTAGNALICIVSAELERERKASPDMAAKERRLAELVAQVEAHREALHLSKIQHS